MVTRRGFVQLCTALLAALKTGRPALADRGVSAYPRVKLVDSAGAALSPSMLEPETGYLFHYPYITTPCFLLRLDRPDPGPNRTVATQNPVRGGGAAPTGAGLA